MALRSSYNGRFDIIAMSSALICTLHCIALPVLFTTLPLMGIELLENIWLELLTLFVSLFIGGWAIWRGFRKFHRQWVVPAIFVLGIGLMTISNILHNEAAEMIMKGVGGLMLLLSHLINMKWGTLCGQKHKHTT